MQKVHVGDYEIFAGTDFPVAQVTTNDIDVSGDSSKVEIEISLALYVYGIRPTQTESLEELSKIAWDESDNSGIMPLLIENKGITIDNRRYVVNTGRVNVRPGTDSANRHLWALEIPLTVKTWKTL